MQLQAASPGTSKPDDDTFRTLLREMWQYRELGWQFAARDVRIRYKQSVMGLAWAVLMPLVIVCSGLLVRTAIAHLAGKDVDGQSLAGIAVKAVPWSFFVGSLGFATTSLTINAPLITKIYFPRALLPIATTFAQGFDSVIAAAAVLLACMVAGVSIQFTAAWALFLAACVVALTVGTAILLACANVFFRDVKYLVQALLTFGIFVTPIFFEPSMFGALGAQLMMLNPLAPLLEGIRLSLVAGHNLISPLVVTTADGTEIVAWTPYYLLYSTVWAAGLPTFGLMVFRRFEFRFAEYV
jgi:lipopolysaccharide transport system permease protein